MQKKDKIENEHEINDRNNKWNKNAHDSVSEQ